MNSPSGTTIFTDNLLAFSSARKQTFVSHLVAEHAQCVADVAAELDRLSKHGDERPGLM